MIIMKNYLKDILTNRTKLSLKNVDKYVSLIINIIPKIFFNSQFV